MKALHGFLVTSLIDLGQMTCIIHLWSLILHIEKKVSCIIYSYQEHVYQVNINKLSQQHILGSVGISNKSQVNAASGSMHPVLTWSELRPDMHQAFMVNGHYTKYE